jgi:hypothetical protein
MEESQTIAASLTFGKDTFRAALAVASQPDCPSGEVVRAPATLADAIHLSGLRDEEKRKREVLKKETKAKPKGQALGVLPPGGLLEAQSAQPLCPGTLIGDWQSSTPFWMFVEVRSH